MNLKSSWRNQLLPLRVLRIWLGATWIYAGWDKASDPGFLTSGSPTFIGTQLSAFAQSSPIGFAIERALEHSALIGIFVILAEFVIGFATLLWIAPTSAAFGGFAMSVALWLASSWNVNPYFLGSDSAYAILWLTYFLFLNGSRNKSRVSLDRRGFMRFSGIAMLALAATGVAKVFPNTAKDRSASGVRAGAKSANRIVKDSAFGAGENRKFVSRAGTPAVLFRTNSGVFAYSAVCTHQGCTVQFNSGAKNLQCACHGAIFDPFNSGAVIAGPANLPLGIVKVAIQGNWIVEL